MKVSDERKMQMKKYYQSIKDDYNKMRRERYHKNPEPYKKASINYTKLNPEKRKQINANFWLKNKDRYLEKHKNYSRQWYLNLDKEKYRKKKRSYEYKKRNNDITYRIKKRLRLRVWQVFYDIRKEMYDKDYHINYKPIIDKLMDELPFDFKDNQSKYQIDHIIPLFKFDLTKQEELEKAFAPSNHQWLTIDEHKEKTSKELNNN